MLEVRKERGKEGWKERKERKEGKKGRKEEKGKKEGRNKKIGPLSHGKYLVFWASTEHHTIHIPHVSTLFSTHFFFEED